VKATRKEVLNYVIKHYTMKVCDGVGESPPVLASVIAGAG
jgi:hypothetical protein